MKTFIKYILQKLLGLKTYLYVFAIFVIVKIRWDKKENDLFHFMKLFTDGGVILDLGANIGVTSYHLAKKFPNSTVYAFEPLTLNMDTLRKVKRKFRLENVREFQMAVGDVPGELEMVMPVIDNVPMHGLSHVLSNENTENNTGFKYKVPVIRLDDFEALKNTPEPVKAIKMDVENFEYHVLKGAENLIKEHRPVIYCELWDNDNRKKCFTFLNNLRYSAFILQKKELVPVEYTNTTKHNFFFMPRV